MYTGSERSFICFTDRRKNYCLCYALCTFLEITEIFLKQSLLSLTSSSEFYSRNLSLGFFSLLNLVSTLVICIKRAQIKQIKCRKFRSGMSKTSVTGQIWSCLFLYSPTATRGFYLFKQLWKTKQKTVRHGPHVTHRA